jgi:predicted AAA+ superfamily ATPase
MTASETAKLPQARLLTELMLAKDTNAVTKIVKKAEQTKTEHCKLLQRAFDTSLHSGGLPGVFFARNIQMRRLKWESQLETILIRDLELISKTTLNYQSKRETLAELARNQGSPLDYKELARKVRISAPTLKKLLIAFEALFLIRIIPCEGGEKRPSFFLEDQGEAQHLTDLMIDERSSFTNALYMHLRVPFMTPLCNLEHTSRVFQFRTRGGAYIPFAFQNGSKALGIIPGLDETPSRIDLASAKSFLNCFKEGIVIYIHPHKKLSILGEGLIQMPVNLSLS